MKAIQWLRMQRILSWLTSRLRQTRRQPSAESPVRTDEPRRALQPSVVLTDAEWRALMEAMREPVAPAAPVRRQVTG